MTSSPSADGARGRASGNNGRARRGDSAELWAIPLRVWVIHWLLVQIPATYALRFGIPNAPSPPYGEIPPPLTGLAHWLVEPLRNWDGLWYRLIALEGYAGGTQSADAEAGPLRRYLLEPDGSVIRARLIGELARRVGGRMIDPTIAWISCDEAPQTPFGQAFEVIERFPLDVKTLKRELAARDIGVLEVKKRGVDVDPAEFRRRLGLRGTQSATLILTRVAGERAAILAERV